MNAAPYHSDQLFKDRVPEAAARQLAVVLAWSTETHLATLDRLQRRKTSPLHEIKRQTEVCDKLVEQCLELGVKPRTFYGATCPLLEQRLTAAYAIKALAGNGPAPSAPASLAHSDLVAEAVRLAEKMMRDSWATGNDAAWAPARAELTAHLEAMLVAQRDQLCEAIRAADDKASTGDYMLDSDDCIAVICGTWKGAS